ncbi:unnamed protein product [Rotaria sordida]|uniref:Tlde1 domain-containing protein n=1 Tax=Rotaria sordida TaxID=392033 RepID=A0A815MVA6_9BILA|nr:unnamed protein product [Rotaria sordida]CAF1430118.1 unnamed protein product [Rotaria sordida]
MTHWTFFKSSEQLCKTGTNECRPAYSGQPGETDQTKKNKGPIPDGDYTFEGPKGKMKFPLIPDKSNNMHGRDAFQIHGDNGRGDKSASKGCIVTNKRDDFKQGDRLHVTSRDDKDGTCILS